MLDSKPPIVPTFRCDRHAPSDGVALVILTGELDLAGADEVEQALSAALAQADSVVIDLQALEFMASAGVRLLLAADRRARDLGRELSIIPGPPKVQRTFELTGVAGALRFADSAGDRRSSPQDRSTVNGRR